MKTKTETLTYRYTYSDVSRSTKKPNHNWVYEYALMIKAKRLRTASGVKDFKGKIKARKDATSVLLAEAQVVNGFQVGHVVLSDPLNDIRRTYPRPPEAVWPDARKVSNSMVDEARSKAYAALNGHINDAYSEFQAGVFAGELRKTVDMLKNPLGSLRGLTERFVRALIEVATERKRLLSSVSGRRHLTKRLAENQKAAADLWLQYRFGVLPLVSDVEQIFDIITEKSNEVRTRRRRFYGVSETSTSSVSDYWDGAVIWTKRVEEVTRVEVILHAGVFFAHDQPVITAGSGAVHRALDVSTLPTTLWELTPFSFVIDYFTNVGIIIEAATQSYADVAYISESTVRTVETFISYERPRQRISPPPPYPVLVSHVPAFSRLKHRTVDRASVASAIPPFHVSLPGRQIQYLNLTALLTSLLLRK